MIPIVVGSLGIISLGLVKRQELEDTIQTTALLRSARILRRVPET